ncbi:MAG: Ferredoxin--nitrite reductase [Firmicutes bacterium]|nr:Ferredoxin--nitrite reductase [Bacillota bacterium]
MIAITEDILKSVEDFKNKLQQYREGKLENLKPFSSIMGIYKEGPQETYMVRPRIAGGVTTIKQLQAISTIAKTYGIKIRFTTRQDIQFHSVKIEDLSNVLDDLLKCGLITRGAGGDGVRNVACSPLSGVAQDEIFDVTPYVKEVTNFMMKDPANLNLPRKYKIAFSNSLEDTANATVADIGFIAKIVNGKRGFEVYGGGGLGGNAKLALKLEDFIADTEALYYVQAMKQVFAREGDRTNRHKARLRFVVQRLGEEEFIKVFRTELDQLRKSGEDLKIHINSTEENLQSTTQNNQSPLEKKYKNVIFPQQQAGYYSLYIHPKNATITTSDLDRVLNLLANLDYEISLRLTLTQGFFVRDLKEKDVQSLLEIVAGFSSLFNIENSVACAGPTICNFGINDSQELLNSILETFRDASDDIKAALPRLLISGCPNSCAQHQKGLIGFTGRRNRTEKGMIPTYSISFNGKVGPDVARFGDVYGDIPAEKIPNLLLDLANLKVNSGYTCFVEFIKDKEAEVRALVGNYSL